MQRQSSSSEKFSSSTPTIFERQSRPIGRLLTQSDPQQISSDQKVIRTGSATAQRGLLGAGNAKARRTGAPTESSVMEGGSLKRRSKFGRYRTYIKGSQKKRRGRPGLSNLKTSSASEGAMSNQRPSTPVGE